MTADLTDRTDFDNADRGFLGKPDTGVVKTSDGRVEWDIDEFADLLQGDAPGTVNPSLWRQSKLTAKPGPYEVTPGIYQVRDLDMSNMTLVEGDTGIIVIDPLISAECAAAAIALYRQHRGDRQVSAVIRLAGWQEKYPEVTVRQQVIRSRSTRALLEYSRTSQLVVVGNRGRGGFTGMLLGSTSQALITHSGCPVVVVGSDSKN